MINTVELQLKKVPLQIKTLISKEAELHRRSINQEAIALLEEALLARAKIPRQSRHEINQILDQYNSLPDKADRPLSELIDYDDKGLPE